MKEVYDFETPPQRLRSIGGVAITRAMQIEDYETELWTGIIMTADHKCRTFAGRYQDIAVEMEEVLDKVPAEPPSRSYVLFKETAIPLGCQCHIYSYEGECYCTPCERVARAHAKGKALFPLTAAQRAYYLADLAGMRLDCEDFVAADHVDDTDTELCQTMLSAWTEWVSQRRSA